MELHNDVKRKAVVRCADDSVVFQSVLCSPDCRPVSSTTCRVALEVTAIGFREYHILRTNVITNQGRIVAFAEARPYPDFFGTEALIHRIKMAGLFTFALDY